MEHLQNEVAQSNEQIAVLVGEIEQLRRMEMEGDIKLREVETRLKEKRELKGKSYC